MVFSVKGVHRCHELARAIERTVHAHLHEQARGIVRLLLPGLDALSQCLELRVEGRNGLRLQVRNDLGIDLLHRTEEMRQRLVPTVLLHEIVADQEVPVNECQLPVVEDARVAELPLPEIGLAPPRRPSKRPRFSLGFALGLGR